MEAGGASPATPSVNAVVDVAGSDVERRQIEEHVAAMPDGYLDATSPEEVLWHLEVARGLDGPAVVSIDPADSGRVLVVGADRAGFLLAVSRAFTANGVGIMDARLRTRADGIALDTFHVRDDRTGEPVGPVKWASVGSALIESLAERRDLRPAVRERVHAYRPPTYDAAAVEVRTSLAGRFAAVEVRAPDRIGLLTDIVEALFGEGLDIYLARIDTMGGQARDVFHVRQIGGAPVRNESELSSLRNRLEDRLRG